MELLSVHVPKTAGVTFRTLLQIVYGKSAVAFDYADRALDPLSTFQIDPTHWRREADRQAATLPPETRVIHGHFGGAKYNRAFPEAHRIVWLREPVARLVSHYHYWLHLPPTPHTLHRCLLDERLSLLEFARLDGMRDILVKVFLHDCRLEDFAFVGVQEHFASELARLARLLEWPANLAIGEENRNGRADYHSGLLSAAEREEIAALNAGDTALYQRALLMRGAGQPTGSS